MENFGEKICNWYEEHGRDLPWRSGRDPYKIWLSEIILQQTRISQGLSYYLKFAEHYPDVHSLAKAGEEEVLKLWQGLGYYSRARNLHHTAKLIVREHQGVFPGSYEGLLKLKGIGEYTAAAIASIAFDEAMAVVDGNVIRVLARIFGIQEAFDKAGGKKLFRDRANELIKGNDPAKFNQALMDFGAIVCTPAKPGCETCIFKKHCFAYRHEQVKELPIRSPGIKIKQRYFHYLVMQTKEEPPKIVICKRSANDIWKNLYDFPLVENNRQLDWNTLSKTKAFSTLTANKPFRLLADHGHYKQQLTHQLIHASFFIMRVDAIDVPQNCKLVKKKDILKYPVSRMIEKFLENYL
ncbi:MAG: A/G-specific adenine glycosylase [Bacteroidota bacterium]|nr:A/G-specific adenine glycosylase [Bacteroidota bacterium]